MSDEQHDHWVDRAPPPLMSRPPAPPPAAHAGGLSDDQVIRIHALAAATRLKPNRDPYDTMRLADQFVNWIKNGPGDR